MSKIIIEAAAAGSESFKPLLWNRVQIKKSLDEICHSLTLELPVSQKSLVHVHDTIRVRFYNRYINHRDDHCMPVTKVYVDEITDTTESGRKYITVLGRSPARDIIDSTWTGEVKGADLLDLTKSIAGRFGITVHHILRNQNHTETIPSFAWNCESPWTQLLNAADNQGYVITSSQIGDLYVIKSGRNAAQWKFILEEGMNIKSVETTASGAEQFHEYLVVSSGVTGRAVDPTCKTKRILTMNLSDFNLDQEKAARRAQIEMYRRRKVTTKVTVSGWGLTDAQIKSFDTTHEKELFFNPNFLIPVYIPSAGLDCTMMISEVEYRAESSVFDCTISLVNPEVYMGKEGTVFKDKKSGLKGKKSSLLEQVAKRHNITPVKVR